MESIYQLPNYSLASITSDELRWLDADALLLQDSPPSPTQLATSRSSPRPRTTSRAKRPHYQRSTKSSSAKSVNRLSGSFNRRHSRSNYVTLPDSPVLPSPPHTVSSPRMTASASLPIKTPPRLTKRTASYSSTHGGSSGSPGSEWIYRRPKSPSASTSSPPRTPAIKFSRRAASASASASDSACTSTSSPASTAENSRSVTPTSTTYNNRSGLTNNYFPNLSTTYLNASSSSLHAHTVNSRNIDAGGNSNHGQQGSGSSIGSIGSIGVLVPSSFGFDSPSVSSLSRQPSSSATSLSSSGPSNKVSLANEKSSTFWTSILPTRSDSTSSGSRIGRLGLGKSKAKERASTSSRPQPSSPLAVHTSATIPSIWSGANVEGVALNGNGTSPKRRKARGSLKELGISSRIPVSSRFAENLTTTLSSSGSSSTSSPPPPPPPPPPIYSTPVQRRPSHARSESFSTSSPPPPQPPIYNTPVQQRPSHTRSESLSSSTSSSTSSALFTNSASSLSSTSPPLTPISPTFPGSGTVSAPNSIKKKFEPHHRVIVEVVEDDSKDHMHISQMDLQRRKSPSPTKSILTSSRSETPPSSSSSSLLGIPGSIGRKKNGRKDSVSTTISSSNKSVKFAEQPTVHYASAIYESWDGTTGAGPFDYDMGRDVGGMEMDVDIDEGHMSEDTVHPLSFNLRSHPYASSDLYLPAGGNEDSDADLAAAEANDTVSAHLEDFNSRFVHSRALRSTTAGNAAAQSDSPKTKTQTQAQAYTHTQTSETLYQFHREDNCITPTPSSSSVTVDRGRVRTSSSGSTGTGTLRSFASLKRKSSSASSTTGSVSKRVPSASPSRSITPRPTISGPYALGSLQTQATTTTTHPRVSTQGLATGCSAEPTSFAMRNAGLRSAPSLESFRSGKSGKSMRSLKSLPERSLKGMKEMRDWFRGRVTVNAI